jgi:hypothetical protein
MARFVIEVPEESADLMKLMLATASDIATRGANNLPVRSQDPATRRYEFHEIAQCLAESIGRVSVIDRNDS